jgi:hypothetical protein
MRRAMSRRGRRGRRCASGQFRQSGTTYPLSRSSARSDCRTIASGSASSQPRRCSSYLMPLAIGKSVSTGPGHTASTFTPVPLVSTHSPRL